MLKREAYKYLNAMIAGGLTLKSGGVRKGGKFKPFFCVASTSAIYLLDLLAPIPYAPIITYAKGGTMKKEEERSAPDKSVVVNLRTVPGCLHRALKRAAIDDEVSLELFIISTLTDAMKERGKL